MIKVLIRIAMSFKIGSKVFLISDALCLEATVLSSHMDSKGGKMFKILLSQSKVILTVPKIVLKSSSSQKSAALNFSDISFTEKLNNALKTVKMSKKKGCHSSIYKSYKPNRGKKGKPKKFDLESFESFDSIDAFATKIQYPEIKYCDLTGAPSKYVDPKTGLYFASEKVYSEKITGMDEDEVIRRLKFRTGEVYNDYD